MQQYFRTGKTIVIDDEYNEAKPLLDALSRNQIPFLYTQGKPNSEFSLPNINPEDAQYYNLIFVDLNLDFKFAGSQIVSEGDEKTFKSTHSQILNTIVKNKNRSFIIVIWSNEEENYLNYYLQLFEDLRYTHKKPYKIISLNKPKYFSLSQNGYQFNKNERGETKPYEDALFNEINNALVDIEAFKLFCEWDRVVSHSVSDAIDDLMSLVNLIPGEENREQHLAKILTLISVAYSGLDGFLNLPNDEEKTDAVLLALTQILNDDIDRNVLNERHNEFKNWKAINIEQVKSLYRSIDPHLINKKLLIYKPNRLDITGSMYLIETNAIYLRRILKDCFDLESTFKNIMKTLKIKYKRGFENEQKRDSQSLGFLEYLEGQCSPIELNVTPLCDIVQDKNINYRIISGFIISTVYYDCIKKSDLAFFYKSPKFILDGNDVFIGLDLRSFSSCTKQEINQKKYLFSLRSALINEVQTKLAAHVSRLGVLYL
ncbi:MAG TPA: hypothetical protein VGM63_21285 [Mucilaginibacter sp.]|jgi:hypothetical protein